MSKALRHLSLPGAGFCEALIEGKHRFWAGPPCAHADREQLQHAIPIFLPIFLEGQLELVAFVQHSLRDGYQRCDTDLVGAVEAVGVRGWPVLQRSHTPQPGVLQPL
ncbi:hypothetical protein D3C85_1633300 [compost metagenome]